MSEDSRIIIPEGADLAQVAEAIGVDPDARPELDTESVDYQAARPPQMEVRRAFLVLCSASGCGIVAARDSREQAEQAMGEHKRRHVQINRRAEVLLREFRGEQLERERARLEKAAQEDPDLAFETKGLDVLDKGPVERDVEYVPDNGYLDWQHGSEASGRDPSKMWHRGCGGEVTIVKTSDLPKEDADWTPPVRQCQKCEQADTINGNLTDDAVPDTELHP